MSTKDSNPKEGIGATRIPFHLIPDGPLAHVAMAFYEGGTKYGPYNWRVAGVRASTYKSAVERHLKKWWNGTDYDPHSRVHHLANAAAGILILLDAELQNKLNDDRPPKQDLEGLFEKLSEVQAHLTKLNSGMNPPNYTEVDYGKEARGESDSRGAGEYLPVAERSEYDSGRDSRRRAPWDESSYRAEPGSGTAAAGDARCSFCTAERNA